MGKVALEECVRRLENGYKINKGVIEAEAHAIETLSSKEDILGFRRKYLKIIEDDLLTKYKEVTGKKEGFYALIEKNYDIHNIAVLKFNDAILFTLGHMFIDNVKKWYDTLPYVSKSILPHKNEMYRVMNESRSIKI